jgi:hypothetical protein
MGIDFSTLVYLPNYDFFARPVTFFPVVSQVGAAAYSNRGIYGTRDIDVAAEDGAILQDHQTILDIRESEYGVLPTQGDYVNIPADGNNPSLGDFEVVNVWHDGQGETTLQLRQVVEAG